MRNGLFVDAFGTKEWYKNDLLHREDGPAIEHAGGGTWWYINGKLHREDGPAMHYISPFLKELENGPFEPVCEHKQWWIDGKEYTQEEFETYRIILKLSGLK